MRKKNIVLGITGASGQIYAKNLLQTLDKHRNLFDSIAVVFTKTGKKVFAHEIDEIPNLQAANFIEYDNCNLFSPFASGSSNYDTLIVVPCSMGMLARISNGSANDLISRTADVMLKEKRKLIIVPREMPYNLIHMRNMETLIQAGAIICPASPAFYGKPKNINDVVNTVVERILKLADFEIETYKWNNDK